MPLPELERLVERKQLSRHQATRRELENHLRLAKQLLAASGLGGDLDLARFTNLYDAAHSVALAGLKLAGYRAPDGDGNRQITLGCVELTLALRPGASAAFLGANRIRSLMHYAGSDVDIPGSLLDALSAGVEEGIEELALRIAAGV